jgi:hypothetical protein
MSTGEGRFNEPMSRINSRVTREDTNFHAHPSLIMKCNFILS